MSINRQHPSLREWLSEAPFGLTLSSGFFGFFAHCGLVSALEDHELQPVELSGSSAGALVASLWAAGLSSEEMKARLFTLDKADFWDPGFGAGLLRGQKFRTLLTELLPVGEFDHCRIPLSLSTTELFKRRTRVLRTGPLPPAIYASCCVPLMFQPIRIDGSLLVDGGVTDRPGLAGMQTPRVLYHHLASRSPWRRKNGAQSILPDRPLTQSLIIENLPRVGPNQLEAGRQAFEQARKTALLALEQPISDQAMRI